MHDAIAVRDGLADLEASARELDPAPEHLEHREGLLELLAREAERLASA